MSDGTTYPKLQFTMSDGTLTYPKLQFKQNGSRHNLSKTTIHNGRWHNLSKITTHNVRRHSLSKITIHNVTIAYPNYNSNCNKAKLSKLQLKL